MFRFVIFLLSIFLSCSVVSAPIEGAPILNNGVKWKLAYVETSMYMNYAGTLYYLLKGLEANGWVHGVDALPYTWGQIDSSEMWKYISNNKNFSDYLDFLPNEFYSLKTTPGRESEILSRFTEDKVADILIVMGTVAGKLLAVPNNKSKVMVFSTSNAVLSGISNSIESSGKPNVWASMDTIRYKQQLEIFADIFKIKKLGIVYEDSPNARAFAAIKDIESIAVKKGYTIVFRNLKGVNTLAEQDEYFKNLLKVNTEIASEIDAFYYVVSPAPGLKLEHLYKVLQPFYDKKIPVFAQMGDVEVKYGALLSVARSDFLGTGKFSAQILIDILNGADISKLPQDYSDPPSLAINLAVAKRIDYVPSFNTLLMADKIFSKVLDATTH